MLLRFSSLALPPNSSTAQFLKISLSIQFYLPNNKIYASRAKSRAAEKFLESLKNGTQNFENETHPQKVFQEILELGLIE